MSDAGKDPEPGRGEISADDREAIRRRAEDIGRRLDQAYARRAPAEDGGRSGSGAAMALGFRIAVEMVVGVGVGGFIGWVLDKQLGTAPWLLVLFVVLGFSAAILNIIRMARRMQAEAEPLQRSAKPMADEDE